MNHCRSVRRRIPGLAFVCAVVVLGASALMMAMPQAQGTPPETGSLPVVVQLTQGRPFDDDVRRLPTSLPTQHDDLRNRGEEPRLPSVSFGDQSAQVLAPAVAAPPVSSSFPGLDFQNYGAGWPPDTNGDVGPTYYIQTVNTSVGIFRKSDGALVGAFNFDTLMSQGHFGNLCDTDNFGDPVVVWDSSADRWIITDFAFVLNAQNNPVAPYFQCFAVSRTGDPLSGGWYFYSLQTTDLFPDYPKLGVWPDGLYLTANMFGNNGGPFNNVRVWALNKTQMYAGAAPTAVIFNLQAKFGNASVFTGIPSTYHNVTGAPPAGRPNFISVIWSSKLARIWKFHVDWNNTANSTLTGPSNVTLASWGVAPTSVPAKNGTALDTLRERLMVQSQYINQSGTESLYLTHTVANPSDPTLTSPRWYQINVTGGTVVTSGPMQQSTWAPDSTIARWMPSLALDKDGNMAIGYSASSSSLFPAIRYAGRLATDPPSTLGQTETSLIEGTTSQSGINRWGDYSLMTIDPDGCTFWYTNEHYQAATGTSNWQTRIGSFKYASCTANSATLTGTVTASATGNPINGATVTAGAASTTTNASGQYTIGSLAAGTYTVTASAAGYVTGSASVTLSAGGTTTQNFALVASGAAPTSLTVAAASGTYGGTTTLSATLTSSGSGVAGKTVNFTLNGNAAGGALTDGSGIATLSNVSLSGNGAGSYPSGVGASFAGDAGFAGSSGTSSLTIAKASQTITFGPLASKTYGDPPFTVSATASSGLPVSFSASGNCTVSGNTVTITGAGSCTITASQPGDSNYLPATNVPQTFSIAKANQTITFAPLPDKTTADPPFTVTATASSGLPVSFSASGNCTVSGNTVTITSTGSCTITASQGGNINYNAAPNVAQTFNITSGGGGGGSVPPTRVQTTGWQRNTADGGQTFTIAINNVTSGNLLVLSVAHKYGNRKANLPTDDKGNTWQLVDEVQNSLTGEWHQVFYVKTAIAGTTTVRASIQSGLSSSAWLIATEVTGQDTTAPLNVHSTLAETVDGTVHRAASSPISLGSDVYAYVSGHINAWANSLNPGTGFAEIDDQDVAGDGSWELEAEDKSASGSYNSDGQWTSDISRKGTSVMVSFLPRTGTTRQSQTITFGALPAKTYGDPPFTVSATASSGLTVIFSASGNCTVGGTTVTITGAGSCTITASQPGDSNYLPAPDVQQTFSIAKASQTITFGALPSKTYGDSPFTVSAAASSGLAVSFSASGNCTVASTTVTITGAGSCTITASQPGDSNYLPATNVPQTFNIAKANQTITFAPLADKTTSDPPFTVTATASSGLPVSFGASGNCTVSGNTVTITGAGSCTITASQGGNVNYNAAPAVPQTFNITSGGGTASPPTRVQTSGWQRNTTDGGQTFTVTINNVGAGHLLIVSVAHKYGNRKVGVPTDDKGNTWQLADEVQNTLSGEWHQVFYVRSAVAGTTTVRATVQSGLTSEVWLIATEVTGQNSTAPLNVHSTLAETMDGSTHHAASGTIALGSDVYVYVSGHLNAWANTVDPGSGFTEIDDQDVAGDGSWELEAEDKSASGSFSSDGQWTSDMWRKGTSVMVSFVHP
jgi:hypothetical protein